MLLKEEYYYKLETSEAAYGIEPSSALSVSRLLQSKSYWKKPFGSENRQKKKLIISENPYPEHLTVDDPHQLTVVTERLQALKNEGFEIYICDPSNNQLLKFENESQIKALITSDLKVEPETVLSMAKKQTLTLDEIFVLNQKEMLDIITGDDTDWNYLTSFKMVDLSHSNINITSLNNCLRQHANEIETLNLNGCINLQNGEIDPSIHLPLLKYLSLGGEPERRANLSRDSSIHLINSANQLVSLDLSAIKIDAIQLAEFLAPAGKLKELNLSKSEVWNQHSIINLNLNELEILDLQGSNISLQLQAVLLHSARKLKKLSLSKCEIPFDELIVLLNLGVLESLHLSFRGLINPRIASNLEKLLTTGKLKELQLDNYDLQWDLPNKINLSNLEVLSLKDNVSLTTYNLEKILISANKLKILNLSKCSGISGEFSSALDLRNLETLILDSTNISMSNLEKLIAFENKIKYLNLDYYHKLHEKIPDTLNLSNLETLKLGASSITSSNLERLLSSSKNLKELNLAGCMYLQNEFTRNLNLSSLKKLDLSFSTITSSNLAKLLSSFKNIKELKLVFCRNLQDEFASNLNLSDLEILDLNYSPIKSSNLEKLLSASNKLKELNLSNCKINQAFSENFNLSNLEILTLIDSTISSSNLEKLLFSSKHLKILNLSRCRDLQEEFTSNLNLNNLERIDLSYSTITASNLEKLLTSVNYLTRLELKSCGIKGSNDEIQRLNTILAKHRVDPVFNPYLDSTTGKSTTKSLDANTTPIPDQKFNVDKLFFAPNLIHDPDISLYRLNTYNTITVSSRPCSINKAFTLKNENDDLLLNLETPPINRASTDLYRSLSQYRVPENQPYYGKATLTLTDEWQALPSLSAHEKMLAYHLSNSTEVEIKRSLRDDLYYICLKNKNSPPVQVDIDFTLVVPRDTHTETTPARVEELVDFCQSFKADSLILNKPNPSGIDYLDALKTQKVGACRHRSLVFKALMQKEFPEYPVRIVNNACHSFVEIKVNGRWITKNLGGYESELVVNQSKAPEKDTATKLSNSAEPTIEKLSIDGKATPVKKRYFYLPAKIKEPPSILQYTESILQDSKKKKSLLKVEDSKDIAKLRYHLEKYCTDNRTHPFFYIDKPEDLICSAAFIQRQADNTGIVRKGPGGALHEFLMQHAKDGTNPVIIVNYDNFDAKDLVRFNALLDPEGKADGTPIPPNTRIVGLFNPEKPEAYTGTDFSSRFDHAEKVPLTSAEFSAPEMTTGNIPVNPSLIEEIELYGGNDWEERLLGRWDLQGTKLVFIEGELIKAIKDQKTNIILKNAPWENDEFVSFWQQTLLEGKFSYFGQVITIPPDFALQRKDGYTLNHYKGLITSNPEIETAHALNPETFSQFLGKYVCTKEGLKSEAGLLQAYKNKTINLYLTHDISLAAWAQFLSLCEKNSITIALAQAPGTTLPKELGITPSLVSAQSELQAWKGQFEKTSYCLSTDPDTTLSTIKGAIILDVSEMTPADLLVKIDGKFDEKTMAFSFEEQRGILSTLLTEGKTVVLTGNFSEEMKQQMSEFLLRRLENKKAPGKLILVSDEPAFIPGMTSYHHEVTMEDKKKASQIASLTKEELKKYSLPELKAIARHRKIHPASPDNKDAWQGMTRLPLNHNSQPISLENCKAAAEAFDAERLSQVDKVLQESPYVFLAGMTGVGKTTFIDKVWRSRSASIHFGEDKVLAWAKDSTPGIKTLFIDEANISSRNWSEFEGLFRDPRGIVIGNKLYPLSNEHKIIFAGNPISYSDERHLPTLFKRHGNSVVFEPLPPAYIADRMLYPVLKEIANKDSIVLPILEVAAYLNSISKDNVLISPRELTMMALFTANFCKQNQITQPESIKHVAGYYAYQLSHTFVPKEHCVEFAEKFQREAIHLPTQKGAQTIVINNTNRAAFHALNDFLSLRKSRRETTKASNITEQFGWLGGLILEDEPGAALVMQGLEEKKFNAALNDFLTLRKIRRENTKAANSHEQFDGLGGLILEGEPGAGKSELAIQALVMQGLEEKKFNAEETEIQTDKNYFYRMPVSMPLDEKKSLLIKAFFEGSVVVIDEFNSAPMMERFLNALLMGKIPDDPAIKKEIIAYGKANPKAGFMLVATQNPAEMGGRGKESPAMLHRMQKIVVGNNSKLEIVEILEHKGLPKEIAEDMAAEYIELREKNKDSICFRDLLNCVEAEQKVLNKSLLQATPTDFISRSINETDSTEKSSLDIFKKKDKEFFAADKQKFGGWFRKNKFKAEDHSWDLKQIIEHAINDNNRSRQVCVALKWMNTDGTLNRTNKEIPIDVKQAFEIVNSQPKPKR